MVRALKAIFAAGRKLLSQWRVMATLAIIYAALLAVLYGFVAMREATAWQVLLTLVFAALAPALFFLLQAMIVNYARGETQVLILSRNSFKDSCKLALASLPLALVLVICVYLLNKWQSSMLMHAPPVSQNGEAWGMPPPGSSVNATPQFYWPQLLLATSRTLIFGFVLPLIAIQLWSAVTRDGLLSSFKRVQQNLARAFALEAVLIYANGLVCFAVIPYFLLFSRTTAGKPSVEFSLFIARLLLVFIFTLYGWVLTLDALANTRNPQVVDALPGRELEAEAV